MPFVSGSTVKEAVRWGDRAAEWAYWATKGERIANAVLGGRRVLRNALIKSGVDVVGKEAHHIIPIQLLKENKVVQDAVNAGFDFNGIENGIALSKVSEGGVHANHPKYTQQIKAALNEFSSANKNFTPEEAKEFLKDFTGQLKEKIKTETIKGGKKINDLKL